jgi:crossover junction endodeoxyribonuclease RuvC
METEKIILGIDPGTNVLGYGLIVNKNTKIEIIDCGVLSLVKTKDVYMKLRKIYEFVVGLIDKYHPDEMSVESPFYAKNVQSMLKLGRAQGVAIAAALSLQVPVFEYSPRKIKQSVTGNGNASKEQVAGMLGTIYGYDFKNQLLDASDAVAVAVCHCSQNVLPGQGKGSKDWSTFISRNPDRIV